MTRTPGILLPKQARYQLRYTPIVIKLWSCKWSNLWSNTFLTAIFCFPNRPKSARLKGFRRFSLSCGANTVYAPKASALPTALHPEILIFYFLYACEFTRMSPLRFPQKHSRTACLGHFALLLVSSPHYARFIIHRMRSQLRPLRNIVALLAWSVSHCSLFLHLIMLASSSAGCARNFVQLRYTPIDIIFSCVILASLHKRVRLTFPYSAY